MDFGVFMVNKGVKMKNKSCRLSQLHSWIWMELICAPRRWFPDEEDVGGRRGDQSADMGHSWSGEVRHLPEDIYPGSTSRRVLLSHQCKHVNTFWCPSRSDSGLKLHARLLLASGSAALPGRIFVKLTESCCSTTLPLRAASWTSGRGWIRSR